MLNSVKEQQSRIERQQREINELKQRQLVIDDLKQIVCTLKPDAAVCQEINK